jgi:hypothetical protein
MISLAPAKALRAAWLATVVAAAGLSILGVVVGSWRYRQHRRAYGLLERFAGSQDGQKSQATSSGNPPRPEGKGASPPDERVARIGQRNVFSPSKPPTFNARVIAIFGDAVLFQDNQLVKVGQNYQEARLTRIGPDWVELEVAGKTTRLEVFGAGGAPAGAPMPPGGMPAPPGAMAMPPGPMPTGEPPTVVGRAPPGAAPVIVPRPPRE